MERTTIDYGIDLGTTNSAIAVLQGTDATVIMAKDGRTFTPSAVWIDKRGRLHVGQEAKQCIERGVEEVDNQATEFKLRMGLGQEGKVLFARSAREMLPEELSAEVLKELKLQVRTIRSEEIEAAVITVPAAFDLPECDATRRAAELAGLSRSPLLQEPVAAALAYGFQQMADRAFWLVYDFGGGTFDTAVIQVRDAIIQVVNHAGDNHLGGKLIDWDIVDKILIPELTDQFNLSDFRRGNRKWAAAVAKLKMASESAKIEVCRKRAPSEIWIENLCVDENGQAVDFEYELTPEEVQSIVSPYVTRSLNLCRKALEEKELTGADMEKVLLVGGSSLIPWLQDRIKDELETELEFSIDPITVIARGAAIFAGTQRLPTDAARAVPTDTFRIDLEYDPVGIDVDCRVGGRIHHPKGAILKGYTVEIVEAKTQWRSGRIPLGPEGTFIADAHAEEGRKCEFLIELCDPEGTRRKTDPDRFAYTMGMVITCPPLTHSIGVAMANNQVDIFFEKGHPLPARERHIHKATRTVRAGVGEDELKIPLVEGENVMRDDRNRKIGDMVLTGDQIQRDLLVHSDVEITITIDESRQVQSYAHIPIIDQSIEGVFHLQKTPRSVSELREDMDNELRRLEEARRKAAKADSSQAKEALDRIDRERIPQQVADLLSTAESPEVAVECEFRLLDLKAAIDKVEEVVEWPTLVEEAQSNLAEARRVVEQYGEEEDRAKLQARESELQKAISSDDADLLRRKSEEVQSHGAMVSLRRPGPWIEYFRDLEELEDVMTDSGLAEQLLARGRRAVAENDLEALKAVVRQLIPLLPRPEQDKARSRGFDGTTIK